jgi:LuxR family transcriptional regulator, maltose regulon positive regulatory protein
MSCTSLRRRLGVPAYPVGYPARAARRQPPVQRAAARAARIPLALLAAELRLVPLLATHLSFREMGRQLYVSQHTVKTQALFIYRKLGVSSRGQAVQRMQKIGLLIR